VWLGRGRRRMHSEFGGEIYWKKYFLWPTRILEDNDKMDLKEIGCEGGWCMEVAQDRVQWRALQTGITDVELCFRLPRY
jgi:hypothetical protein